MAAVHNNNAWINFATVATQPDRESLASKPIDHCTFALFKDFALSFLPGINCYQVVKRGQQGIEQLRTEKNSRRSPAAPLPDGARVRMRSSGEIFWSFIALALITLGATILGYAMMRGDNAMLGDLVEIGRTTIGIGLFVLLLNAAYVRWVRDSGFLQALCRCRSRSTPPAAPPESKGGAY